VAVYQVRNHEPRFLEAVQELRSAKVSVHELWRRARFVRRRVLSVRPLRNNGYAVALRTMPLCEPLVKALHPVR